jgi:hypothetical protein
MAQQRTDRQPTQTEPIPKKRDLTVNKVMAGAGAAATSAVLGSYFGAAGTVAGAAIGSVASTVATSIYQHSLDRTRDKITARIQQARAGGADAATQVMPRLAAGETVRLQVEPDVRPGMSRRRIAIYAGATVLAFVLALLAVTGLEWAKGSSLTTGQEGTSVGRVIQGEKQAEPPEQDDKSGADTTSSSATPSSEPSSDNSDDSDDSEKKSTTGAKPSDGPEKAVPPTSTVPTSPKKPSD